MRKRSCGNGSRSSNRFPAGARSSSNPCTLQCSHSLAASKGARPRQVDRRGTHHPRFPFLLGSLLPAAMVEAADMEGGRGTSRGLRRLPAVCFRQTTTLMAPTIGSSGLGTTTTTRCRRSRTCIPPGGCRLSRSLQSTPILDQGVHCGNAEARMGSAPVGGSPRPHPCRRCIATLPRRGRRIRWNLMLLRSRRARSMHSLSVTLRTRILATQRSARSICST